MWPDPPEYTEPPTPAIPPELQARMDALSALALAAWDHGLDWQIDYDGSWRCYARDNLTTMTLEYPYK